MDDCHFSPNIFVLKTNIFNNFFATFIPSIWITQVLKHMFENSSNTVSFSFTRPIFLNSEVDTNVPNLKQIKNCPVGSYQYPFCL